MYYLKMRRWLTNLSQIIGSVLLLSLLTLVISSSFHKVSWVPEAIRSTLHLGEPESIIGPVGPVGPIGIRGEKGEKGEPGAQGAKGVQGKSGEQGEVGPVGPTGKTGSAGKIGKTGKSGSIGAKGDQGDAGSIGLIGPKGEQGPPGAQGERGPVGLIGAQGVPGVQGIPGAQGVQGIPGIPGAQGLPGIPGAQGLPGIPGAQGIPGIQGAQGIPGVQGLPGLLQGIYGSYLDTTTQTNITPGQPIPMRLNTSISQRQVSLVNGSKIQVASAGTYNVQFSAQMFHTANEASTAEIWLRVNGNDVPASNTIFTFAKKDDKYVAAWNFMIDLDANDFVQLMWYSIDTTVQIVYVPEAVAPLRPSVPSLILTINQVG